MTSQEQQIVKLYEELHYDIELISNEVGFDTLQIKAVLSQYSAEFRKALKVNSSIDFTEDEQAEAKAALVETMRCTEDENLKFRTAKFIRNDGKGRLDFAKGLVGLNINVFEFNERLNKMRLAKELTFNKEAIVDVTSK